MIRGGIIEDLDLEAMVVILDDPFGSERIPVSDIINIQCSD